MVPEFVDLLCSTDKSGQEDNKSNYGPAADRVLVKPDLWAPPVVAYQFFSDNFPRIALNVV